MCVSVALQQWRQQDTWHHTDVTQHSTLQDAGDSLTWKMRHRSEQAQRKLNPASAYCRTTVVPSKLYLQRCFYSDKNSPIEKETQLFHLHFYSQWGLHCICVCSSQNWPIWTLTNFIQMREKQLKTTSGTCVRNYKNKHICVHFLLGNCPVLRNFDASCSHWLHASVCTVLLHWQALASLSFSIFFFSKKYLLAGLN